MINTYKRKLTTVQAIQIKSGFSCTDENDKEGCEGNWIVTDGDNMWIEYEHDFSQKYSLEEEQ